MQEAKIGIMGFGFVGQALAGICNEPVKIYDPKFKENRINGYKVDLKNCDIIFICVGSPSKEDGSLDDTQVMSSLEYLNKQQFKGLVVIKSTILYGHISEFISKSELKIVVNPEFLSQISSYEDAQNQTEILIGCDNIIYAKELMDFYDTQTNLVGHNFEICSIKEACDFKYIRNIFGATLVTFWEMVHDCTGGNSRKMAKLLNKFPLPSKMNQVGMDGERGFSGACFPKDVAAWSHFHSDKFTRMLLEYNQDVQD